MANVIPFAFRGELFSGTHNFSSGGNAFKIALYTANPYTTASTTYTTSSEEYNGSGWVYGGNMNTQRAPYGKGGFGILTAAVAMGGLSGGDKSGPPPERGPNPQGLLSLMKRGMRI